MDLLLLVSPHQRLLDDLQDRLGRAELPSLVVTTLQQAASAMERGSFSVLVLDLDGLDRGQALAFFAEVHRRSPHTHGVALASEPTLELALLCMRHGQSDLLATSAEQLAYLPVRVRDLHRLAQATQDRQALLVESARMNEEILYKLTDMARKAGEARVLLNQRSGSPSPTEQEQAQVLLVEEDGWAARVLSPLLPKTFVLTSVISGGAALDSASERGFDIALVRDMLPDLPGRMVVRNLSVQAPEAMVLLYSQPQPKRPGRVERSEGAKLLPLIADWLEPKQLADRLRELFQAQLARRRERKHLAEFRSEHIELLRRFSDLRKRTRAQIGDFEAAAPAASTRGSGANSPLPSLAGPGSK